MPFQSLSRGLLLLGLGFTAPALARVAIELATLHVAGLTTAHGAGDETDAPDFLISVIRPHGHGSAHLPASGHWRLAENAVVTPTAVDLLELAPNEGGTVWWRRMDCVQDCAVLQGIPNGTGAALSQPTSGVYELTGAGGIYHLNLSLKAVN